jgi:uncharacterized protein
MSDASALITSSAALIAGLAGSVHCVAMCGGLAGALGMRRSTCPGSWRTSIRAAGLHHAGRLAGYSLAGALFGWLGVTLQSAVNLPMLSVVSRVAAGGLLVLVAARILFGWNTLASVERLGARFWRSIRPLVGRAASSRSSAGNLVLGLLWGWLPCGLVYSMLLFAAMSGDAASGAGIMLAFGVGTLPAMLASSVLASRIAHALSRPGTRQAMGALLLLFGIWLGWAGVVAGDHLGHSHFPSGHRALRLSSGRLHDLRPQLALAAQGVGHQAAVLGLLQSSLAERDICGCGDDELRVQGHPGELREVFLTIQRRVGLDVESHPLQVQRPRDRAKA